MNALAHCALPAALVAACSSQPAVEDATPTAYPDFPAELRSADEQTRCDAFHQLFDEPELGRGAGRLSGMTTAEVEAVLGEPDRVATLTHEGVEWLQIAYSFDGAHPRAAGEAGERAYRGGWRYAPTLVFRDRVAVPPDRLSSELGLHRYSALPQHLRFVPGGEFP